MRTISKIEPTEGKQPVTRFRINDKGNTPKADVSLIQSSVGLCENGQRLSLCSRLYEMKSVTISSQYSQRSLPPTKHTRHLVFLGK